MTKSAVAIRHLHFEDAALLEDVLPAAGYALTYLDVWREPIPPDLDPDLLIVLGGPIGVYDHEQYPFLNDEIALLKTRLAADRPTLGICLGAQLMAAALGSKVYSGPAKEIGWAALTDAHGVLGPLGGYKVLHWHGDTFDLPHGATRLASTPICANQAFARGPNVLALQFHAEVSADQIESWLIGHTGELYGLGILPTVIRAETKVAGPALRPAATRMFEDWLAGLN